MYLGHYYSQVNRDLDRARRCYQKAFRLNPNCKEAGAGLSDIYRLQKNPVSEFCVILNSVAHDRVISKFQMHEQE